MDKQTPSPSSLPSKKPKLTGLYDVILAYKWPVLIVTLVMFLRTPIGLAISQITHGEFSWGKDNGLKVLIDKLASSTSEITSTPTSPAIPAPDQTTLLLNTNNLQAIISNIIEETSKSPRVALLKTGFELEKKAQEILFATNWGGGRADFTLGQSIDKLIELGQIPRFATDSFQLFNIVRYQVVHEGNTASDQDLISAIDSGIVLLRVLYAIPVEENIVYNPGVIIYADAECKNEIENARGLILQTTSPGGEKKTFRIFPTSKTDYFKGERVSWEWNMNMILGAAWYFDPDTKEIKTAWTSSAEFVGRDLNTVGPPPIAEQSRQLP